MKNQKNVVTIYRNYCMNGFMMSETGRYYSLYPWSGDDRFYEGFSDGSKQFFLPDGYTVANDTCGCLHIWDDNDSVCDFSIVYDEHNDWDKIYVVGDDCIPILLKEVPEEEF